MSIEIWQAIPAVDKDDLRPILSTLSDRALEQQVVAELGLTEADSLNSVLLTRASEFEDGRFIAVNSLQPIAMQRRVEADLAEEADARWFQAAASVLRLTEQQSQGCYGGWRKGFALSVFGQ